LLVEMIMNPIYTSAPAKIILFGEHGVNRQQPALATAADMRTYCRVEQRTDDVYSLRSDGRYEEGAKDDLIAFRAKVDALREAGDLEEIRKAARDFFAPTRYVLGYATAKLNIGGVNVTWRSDLPVGSGLGSGAAASTSMVRALCELADGDCTLNEIIELAWQGDIIAHGGVASSLDSSTSTYGGLVRYSTAAGTEILPIAAQLPLVVGDTGVQHNTAAINTHVRRWLEEKPVRMSLFGDMGYVVQAATDALEAGDLLAVGHLMNIHHLFQEKMGTSIDANETLIEAALGAGALGAKVSGSGRGGVIISLVEPGKQEAVANAIDAAGGKSYIVTSGAEGVRLEHEWVSG